MDPFGKLAELDPAFRARVIVMMRWIRQFGVPLIIISGFRSPQHQAQLVATGRGAPRSLHLQGRAVDVQWEGFLVAQVPLPWWQWFGAVGEAVGLRWGGRFSRPDLNHFDDGTRVSS